MKAYRIQPKGLDIKGHVSQTSVSDYDPSGYVHVFDYAQQVFSDSNYYYDHEEEEIIEIECPETYDNEDVDGSGILPDECEIVNRYSWDEFALVMFGLPTAEEAFRVYPNLD